MENEVLLTEKDVIRLIPRKGLLWLHYIANWLQ